MRRLQPDRALGVDRARSASRSRGLMADRAELEVAVQAVRSAPHSTAAWDEVEGLAAELDRPDDVVALYREVLSDDLGRDIVEMIGERAAAFADEWFGDEPAVVEG